MSLLFKHRLRDTGVDIKIYNLKRCLKKKNVADIADKQAVSSLRGTMTTWSAYLRMVCHDITWLNETIFIKSIFFTFRHSVVCGVVPETHVIHNLHLNFVQHTQNYGVITYMTEP